MTKSQKTIVEKDLILLNKADTKEITGWGKNKIDDIFANDENFPAIKIGKEYQVEFSALKEYFSIRRTKKK